MTIIKKLTLIASLLLVIGLIGGVVTLSKVNNAWTTEETVIDDTSFHAIDLTTDNAKIDVLPTTEEQAKIVISGNEQNYTLSSQVRHDILEMKVTDQNRKWFNLFPTSYAITIYLPEKQYESIKVNSNNGTVHVQDLDANIFSAQTKNGDVVVTNMKSASIAATSTNEDILIENIHDATENITGKTTNGDILLTASHVDRNVDLSTVNGDITVTVDTEPTSANITTSVTHGDVTLFNLDTSARIFGGGEHTIQLDTVNGDIMVGK
ncbi:DUF4097 family beta strand repeat-containing protein [Shouchella lonarensis]|uniref:Adhesin n=1 Tax=Shouchella lonarensis TaxID=1464122 RepID=A0A1G6HD36_9BACI|nr:DUF4097 family beta strand repeat-containing protein [Shouchella lonarensis]SDB92227.1 Putative adhesin [Shouchella lonarensis]